MINPSFKELEKVSKSRYDIAMLIANRAKELIAGDKPKIKTKANKPVTVALTELMSEAGESEE